MTEIAVEFPAEVPPGAQAEIEKCAEKYGGYIVSDEAELPGEVAPPVPPTPEMAGQMLAQGGPAALRPPGLVQ